MAADRNIPLHKAGQLAVVVVGFFSAVLLLLLQAVRGTASGGRLGVMWLMALGLAVRYWWVILLLEWPFRIARVVLLLLAWSVVAAAAAMTDLDRAWVLLLAALGGIGAATEFYNLRTQQWRVGSEALSRTLRRDHVVGGITALAASGALVGLGIWLPTPLTGWVMCLVVADWVRLMAMVASHRRLLHAG